jgi:hypothetical protein
MSLLGANVYANPTTPIWGQGGGGGGGSNFQTLNITEGGNLNIASPINLSTQLNFYKDVSGTTQTDLVMYYYPDGGQPSNLCLAVFNEGNNADRLTVGDLQVAGTGTTLQGGHECLSIGKAGTAAYGIRQLGTSSNVVATYLDVTPNTTDMNLSNVKTINGVPYAPTLTSFDFSNWAGSNVAESPNYSVINSLSFTAPTNGKLYMESLGTFVSATQFGGGLMSFSVNGSNISNANVLFNAYDSNINIFGMSMYQIPVTGGLTYDISSIAQCSALPPAGSDLVINTSRLFSVFTPN